MEDNNTTITLVNVGGQQIAAYIARLSKISKSFIYNHNCLSKLLFYKGSSFKPCLKTKAKIWP